jgi:cytochrome c6
MKRIALAIAVLALSTAGIARAEAPAELFAKKCSACHGKDGKGQTPMAQKLGAKDLTTVKSTEAEIAKVIAEGRGKMGGFKGKIADPDIQALATFVKAGLK